MSVAESIHLPFVKMQGAGNDFVMVDGRHRLPYNFPDLARVVCDRHFGIGADGLIVLEASKNADFKMAYFNADGSKTICGNGMRCCARFIYRLGAVPGDVRSLDLETETGIVHVDVIGKGERVRVDMGPPTFDPKEIPFAGLGEQIRREIGVAGEKYRFTAVGMGNPHCVIFVEDLESVPLSMVGPALENHQLFPERTNVHFVKVIDSSLVYLKTWERGVGETLACGSGNCAVLAAGVREGRLDRKITLRPRGGEFQAVWDEGSGRILLTGPAEEVFSGDIVPAELMEKWRGREQANP